MIETLIFDNDAVASLFEMQSTPSCLCELSCENRAEESFRKASLETCPCIDSGKFQLDLDYYPIAPKFQNSINCICYKQELAGFHVYSKRFMSLSLIPLTPPPRV
jgi:hypothetical protein